MVYLVIADDRPLCMQFDRVTVLGATQVTAGADQLRQLELAGKTKSAKIMINRFGDRPELGILYDALMLMIVGEGAAGMTVVFFCGRMYMKAGSKQGHKTVGDGKADGKHSLICWILRHCFECTRPAFTDRCLDTEPAIYSIYPVSKTSLQPPDEAAIVTLITIRIA